MGHGENLAARLRKILFLKQADEVFLEEIPSSGKYGQLMSNVLLFAKDHDLSQKVFDTVGLLTDRVPFQYLNFTPDDSFWRCLDDSLG